MPRMHYTIPCSRTAGSIVPSHSRLPLHHDIVYCMARACVGSIVPSHSRLPLYSPCMCVCYHTACMVCCLIGDIPLIPHYQTINHHAMHCMPCTTWHAPHMPCWVTHLPRAQAYEEVHCISCTACHALHAMHHTCHGGGHHLPRARACEEEVL